MMEMSTKKPRLFFKDKETGKEEESKDHLWHTWKTVTDSIEMHGMKWTGPDEVTWYSALGGRDVVFRRGIIEIDEDGNVI